MLEDNLGAAVLAAGALGTAAFGIVEGLKVIRWLAEAGFSTLVRLLGPIMNALRVAYGQDSERLLRAQYRGDREQLTRVLRQGARVGLTKENAESLAASLGSINGAQLKKAAEEVEAGKMSDESRNVLGRFELAVDARIDAGLTLALDHYARAVKITASAVALVVAAIVAYALEIRMLEGLIVGLAAVPLAPVAKDVATAVKSAAEALRARA